MDIELTSEQELFVQTSERFIESTWPLSAVREHIDDGCDTGGDYRRKAADLGWFAMLVPEDLGGGSVSGNGVLDAALVAYVRGAVLQPGAFVGTNVVCHALAKAGTADQRCDVLPALVSGESAASWAVGESGSGAPMSGWSEMGSGAVARRQGDSYVLSGTSTLVQDADRSAWILVTAASAEGLVQMLVPAGTQGVHIGPMDGLDITRRFCQVAFEDAVVPDAAAVGEAGATADLVEQQLQIACVLTVAESVGAMDRDFGLALQYAKDRIAFGRPIGSFQAVKHLLADTSLMLEMGKALAWDAARAVGAGQPRSGESASVAKAFVGDCGIELAQNCWQVFGGIGYTWEHDQHLYLRRITTDAALYGDPAWHRERICQLGGL